jgi:hypothetical protein
MVRERERLRRGGQLAINVRLLLGTQWHGHRRLHPGRQDLLGKRIELPARVSVLDDELELLVAYA